MKALLAGETLPIGEFKTHASQVIKRLRESGRPVLITQHGSAAAVLIPVGDYDRIYREHVVAAIERGLADAAAGRVHTEEEVFAELEALLGPLPVDDEP